MLQANAKTTTSTGLNITAGEALFLHCMLKCQSDYGQPANGGTWAAAVYRRCRRLRSRQAADAIYDETAERQRVGQEVLGGRHIYRTENCAN